MWQGTQLLAFDSAAAVELLRRSVVGDELTEKEKKALRRTMTDLASVVPIGVLMLLPVSKPNLIKFTNIIFDALVVHPHKNVSVHYNFLLIY